MIRYVVAVLLTVFIVGIAVPAVDYGAGLNGERQVRTALSEIDEAATSLYDSEEVPPRGVAGPHRVVTVRFPVDSMTSNPVATVRIRRVGDNRSVVEYRVEGRAKGTYHISAPIVNVNGGPVVLGGTGEREFVLTLERDDSGRRVVVLGRA